jgi:hypothetical protein
MKRIAFSLAFLMALIALRLESIAQVETLTDSTVNRLDSIKSYSLVGMVYNSDIVFLGR